MTSIPEASEWEQRLYDHLTSHVEREGELLGSYVAASRASASRALAFVVDMLAADERRHHALFRDLASSLKIATQYSSEPLPVPALDFEHADTAGILALTRTLIDGEKADRVALRELQKELRDVADTSLWALLVDTMRMDTEKHLRILRFVEMHAKSAARKQHA